MASGTYKMYRYKHIASLQALEVMVLYLGDAVQATHQLAGFIYICITPLGYD